MSEPNDMTDSSSQRDGGVDLSAGQVNVGRDVAGRDVVTAGRDVAGRDVVTVTHAGLSAADIQRLLITLGVLLIFMFLCGFSGGLVIGRTAFTALAQAPTGGVAGLASAEELANALKDLEAAPPGVPFELDFSERQLDAYARYMAGPALGLDNARARLLDDPGQIAVSGQWADLGNMSVAAIVRFAPGDRPFKIESAAVQVVSFGNSSFGWVAVPAVLLQPLVERANDLAGADVAQVSRLGDTWSVTVVKR